MKIPINRATRLVMVTTVIYMLHKARVEVHSFKKAVALSNDVSMHLISSVVEHIEQVIASTKWQSLFESMESILDEYHFAKIPDLFSVGATMLVQRVEESARKSLDQKESSVTKHLNEFLDVNLGVVTNLVTTKLRKEIEGYTSDHKTLETFEKNVALVKYTIVDSTPRVLVASSTARFAKLRSIFEDVLSWKLKSYERFLHHTTRIRLQLNPVSQLETWVELSSQKIVGAGLDKYLSHSLFGEYMALGASGSSAFIDFLDTKFSDVSVSDFAEHLESYFRTRVGDVDSIIDSQYAETYVLLIEAIESDDVLDASQKRVLKTFAREVREESEENCIVYEVKDSDLTILYEEYTNRLLKEIRVVILVAFLEYETISLRAVAVGRQTCIVEFYDMRKAIDRALFFEYARERSFDLEKTETDFHRLLTDSLENTRASIFSLVDTSYVHYLFDETRTFLLSRPNLLFFDDIHLLPQLKPMIEALHESYAEIIPKRFEEGIDLEHDQEATMTKLYIESAFTQFLTDMEFSFTKDLIDGSRTSILNDVVDKVAVIHAELSRLPTDLSREFLQPFSSDYFKSTTGTFVTDDIIDYIGMKKFVIDETVSYAAGSVEKTRTTYKEQIHSLFKMVDDFINSVASDLVLVVEATERQDPDRVDLLLGSAKSARDSMLSFSNTIKGSTMVRVEEALQSAMEEVQDAQQVRLFNYFNTKIQLIKDEFTENAVDSMVAVFEDHLGRIEEKMSEMSGLARSTFRNHVSQFFALEHQYRSTIDSVAKTAMDERVNFYLENYYTVSFGARESIFKAEMRKAVTDAASDVILERRLEISRLGRKWADARLSFRNMLFDSAGLLNASFRHDLNGVMQHVKSLAVDIMGHVDEVLDALDRDVRTSIQSTYATIVDNVVGSTDNELPEEIGLTTIVFTPGIMDLTDAPEIPADAFKRSYREPDGNKAPEVDEPSGFNTTEIVMLTLEWDLWIKGRVDEIVQNVVESMTNELTQNTCTNKPPCREGWVQEPNLHGVLCCTFNPEAQGYQGWQIAGMLAKELALGLLLDVEMLSKVSARLGDTALKNGYQIGKSIGNSQLATATRNGSKMVSKGFYKYAGNNPQRTTKAISLAGKTAGKNMSKVAGYVGQKSGAKAAAKLVAKKGFSKLLKSFLSGPAGVALFIFDVVSLVLDLWDPAGYNEEQNAALMRVERDMIEEYYKNVLHDSGFDSPFLADPMFSMSPGEKQALWEETYAEWQFERMATFMAANEQRFEFLSEFEQQNEIIAHNEHLARELDEDTNILTTLVAQKLENVFLQDLSTRENHTNPHTDGGPNTARTHVRQHLPPSGILEIALNETGVQAFNIFAQKKAHFFNSLKYNPFYRYVKRENNYMITKDTAIQAFLRAGEKCTIEDRQTAGEYSSPHNPYYNYETIEDCVRAAYPLLTPTPEGSLAFADATSDQIAETHQLTTTTFFANEIREMVREGWVLNKVDAEEEFRIQYDPDKTDLELLDRSKYQKAHEDLAEAHRYQYHSLMDATISLHVDENLTPEDGEKVSITDIKVIHLANFDENWTKLADGTDVLRYPLSEDIGDVEKVTYIVDKLPTVPSWVPPYQEMFNTFAKALEAEFKPVHDENMRLLGEAYEEAQEKEQIRLTEKAVKELKSVREVLSDESVMGRSSEPDPPDFAVFLNGYGQSSPLYSIANECNLLGHGVTYDASKGLCNFSESYCSWYGVDFFYNADLGVYDCEMSRAQMALEYIFGTTITRSTKRGWNHYDKNGNLIYAGYAGYALGSSSLGSSNNTTSKKIGTCRKALGSAKINGVEVKQVQNGDNLNHVDTKTTLQIIGGLGLSGF